jgi:hypothetical protein
VDTRDGHLLLHGVAAATVTRWTAPLVDPADTSWQCTVRVFYNTAFARLHGTTVERYIHAVMAGVSAFYATASLPVSGVTLVETLTLRAITAINPATTLAILADAAAVLPLVGSTWLFDGGSYPNHLVGLAYVGQACQQHNNAVLIAGPVDVVATLLIAAHELGHALGAWHDGSPTQCPSQGYLMAPILDLSVTSFSPCARDSIWAAWPLVANQTVCWHNTSGGLSVQPAGTRWIGLTAGLITAALLAFLGVGLGYQLWVKPQRETTLLPSARPVQSA